MKRFEGAPKPAPKTRLFDQDSGVYDQDVNGPVQRHAGNVRRIPSPLSREIKRAVEEGKTPQEILSSQASSRRRETADAQIPIRDADDLLGRWKDLPPSEKALYIGVGTPIVSAALWFVGNVAWSNLQF